MNEPLVFVSYSHDSSEHKAWVLKLATDLRTNGVDATLDQWDLVPGQDISAFMQHGIADSHKVVLVCSASYVGKADAGSGGVGYERLIVTAELVQNIDTKKFIPVIRNNQSSAKTPTFLGPRLYIDFTSDADYAAKLQELLRAVHGVQSSGKPSLGANPFSAAVSQAPSISRTAGPTGITTSGLAVLEDDWFVKQAEVAATGLRKLGISGSMELRFALHDSINKSQLDLLNAVQQSEIQTFGWPIGVTLDNRDEFRPRPVTDGIVAEIAYQEKSTSLSERSYDYWALRNNGDFYLLQDLFEDQRTQNKIFFNTRIVRVTESLMFAANLYEKLGVAPETKLSIRVTHAGLAKRDLTSSSPNRHIFPASSTEELSQTQIVESLGQIRVRLVDNARQILEPLFMLFDFKKFEPRVYEEIVNNFVAGRVT